MVYVKRVPEQSTPTAQAPDATSTIDANNVMSSIPMSTVALAVIVSVFGFILLAMFVGWKMRVRRKRRNAVLSLDGSTHSSYGSEKSSEKSGDLESSGYGVEKPEKAFAPAQVTPYLGEAGWVPQIRTYHGIPVRKLPKEVQVSLENRKFQGSYSFAPSERTPPPAYVVTNGGADRESSMGPTTPPSIPLPPVPVTPASIPPTPPTPPANKHLKVPKPLASRFSADSPIYSPGSAQPLPSPARDDSFQRQQTLHPAAMPEGFKLPKKQRKKSEPQLPRLMTVVNTFIPSRDDELAIKVSETVRMLEEYHDGWCLVQSTDGEDAPQGVIPRFCLVERQTVIPASSPSRRSKFSSAFRVSRF
ncbi:hypothetical protein VKT23_010976 [Stygiomarasmius scandens]|uniref:SH3 domain-containing protein n=1 Tax=Marasmiellus scandens TaxID=2682957 RepID=A0ABR1JDM4_9AGAR